MPLSTKLVATGLTRPLFVTAPPGDMDRLFIVEQVGRIRILNLTMGILNPVPFLQLTELSHGNEQGLLGLAFHPDYATNGLFYVNFTDVTGTTNIRRFKVSVNPDVADPSSGQTLLTVSQPFANHNGGWIAFGPDRMLYISMGDGGSGNDPGNRAQNLNELLGKILRIDVDGADPGLHYHIPNTNPFVNTPNARGEIWVYGLRNPWRCSFDRQTGDLYIADVGQDQWEEVNFQPAGSQGGENYGWRVKEGRHETGLDVVGGRRFVEPIHEYDHNTGIAIIGGYVYRGHAIPNLQGAYLFADNTGPIWSLRHDGAQVTELTPHQDELFPSGAPSSISSFGEDAAGELYVLNLIPGHVYRLEPQPVPAHPLSATAAIPTRGRFRALHWNRSAPPAEVVAEALMPMSSVDAAIRELGFPEVPGVSAVEEARILLQVAAEVEHALLVQYLYAMYSLDISAPPVSSWFFRIRDIAKEEMGHLITVQNLLLAIGGEPYFDREPVPTVPAGAMWDPFPFKLEPLTLTALAKYVTVESPLPEQLSDDVRERALPAYRLARLSVTPSGGTPTDDPAPELHHIGVLYARLYWLFQPDETPVDPWKLPPGRFPQRHLTPADFVGNLDRQADTNETQGSNEESHANGIVYVKTITSAADARTALSFIASQGEGWVTDPNYESHFERFLAIFEEYPRQLEAGWEPTLPLPTNPVIGDQPLPDPSAERNRITHPAARMWVELFNTRYRMLVGEMWLAMCLPRSDPKRSDLFSHAISTEMRRGVGAIAKRLVTLARKADVTGSDGIKLAGPPFRMPDTPMPQDANGLRLFLKQQIATAAQWMAQLESPGNPIPLTSQDKSLLNTLRSRDAVLIDALAP
jgi:glucose/arabinose dehydrogenase